MLLLLLLFVAMIICGTRRAAPGLQDDFLSPAGSSAVRGVAAAAVVLHHLSKEVAIPSLLLPFLPIGFLAVTLFYFYSGYGLYKQMEKRPDYLTRFYRNRLPKLLVPFWCVNLLYAAWQWGIGVRMAPWDWALSILGVRLLNEDAWYVLSLLFFYAAFHLCYGRLAVKKAEAAMGVATAAYMVGCMAAGQGLWRFVSAGGFWLGLLYARRHAWFQNMLNRGRVGDWCLRGLTFFFVGSMIFQALSYFRLTPPVLEQEFCIAASGFLLCVFWHRMPKIRFGNRASSFLGKISYEVYLVHRLFLRIFHHPGINVENDALYSLLCAGCAVLLAAGLHALFAKLLPLLQGKRARATPVQGNSKNMREILGILPRA